MKIEYIKSDLYKEKDSIVTPAFFIKTNIKINIESDSDIICVLEYSSDLIKWYKISNCSFDITLKETQSYSVTNQSLYYRLKFTDFPSKINLKIK